MGARVYNYDADLELKDSYAVTASAAGQVDSADKIINMGNARFEGVAVIDVTAVKISANDEYYTIIVQGSTSATFASVIQNLAEITLGATEVRPGGAIDSEIGRYELPFTNEQDDTVYPYIRIYTVTAGSSETITYSAWMSTQAGR